VVAPRLQHRFGTVPTLLVNLLAMTATLVVMALGTDSKAVLAACVVVSGLFIGINNTLITETVMKAAPVERGVASAAYSFVRFSGAAVAPWLAVFSVNRSACICRSGWAQRRCCSRPVCSR
jgi:cyanate permease